MQMTANAHKWENADQTRYIKDENIDQNFIYDESH